MNNTAKICICLASLWSVGCDKNPFSTGRDVTYHVTGSGTADITYQASAGSTEQRSDRSLPWSTTVSGAKKGDFVYVSAQKGSGSGCVTAEIKVDNKVVESAASCGPFVIATASGTLK